MIYIDAHFFFQKLLIPSGKVLGGSSVINYLVYTRGSPHDYDGWVQMGCEGWSYDEVMPYFLKSEAMSVKKLAKNKGIHNLNVKSSDNIYIY